MRALPQFALSLATILLCAGVTAGADLESAQHAYQATALQDATALAEQGQAEAQVVLGQTCMEGLPGLPRDPVQGGMWLRLAAKDNLPFYAAQLAAAERVMSPEQRAQSKALAAAWQPQPGLRREAPPSP